MGREFLIECEDWVVSGNAAEAYSWDEPRVAKKVVKVEIRHKAAGFDPFVLMTEAEAGRFADGLLACIDFAPLPPPIAFADVVDVAAQAVRTWGRPAQTAMIVEEFGEFLTAFARLSRGRSSPEQVIDEAADVIVVLGSALALVNDDPTDALQKLAEAVDRKVARLRKRLANAQPST